MLPWRTHQDVPAWLLPHTEEIWTTDATSSLILPDNCMDLVRTSRGWRLAGPSTKAYEVEHTAPAWGVRFVPGVLPLLLGLPAHAALDLRGPLSDALEAGAAPELWAARLDEARRSGDLGMVHALSGVSATTVAGLARVLGWSERHTQRKMRDWVGYPARTWLRVRRLRALAQALRSGTSELSELAFLCGYADQSHMTRECRALTGHTPGALRLQMGVHSSMRAPSGSRT